MATKKELVEQLEEAYVRISELELELEETQYAVPEDRETVDSVRELIEQHSNAHNWINNYRKYDYDTGYRNGYKRCLYEVSNLIGMAVDEPFTHSNLKREIKPE